MAKDVIKKIIQELPLSMQDKAKRSYERYKAEKREELTPAVVERLYLQLLAEALERGK